MSENYERLLEPLEDERPDTTESYYADEKINTTAMKSPLLYYNNLIAFILKTVAVFIFITGFVSAIIVSKNAGNLFVCFFTFLKSLVLAFVKAIPYFGLGEAISLIQTLVDKDKELGT